MIASAIALGRMLLGFLRTPIGQILAVCAIFGGLAWWHGETRFAQGVDHERGAWELRQEADAVKARAVEARQAAAGQSASQAVEKIRTVTQWRTKTIVEQIPYAVPSDPDRPGLPWGFVRLHDAAAVGVSEIPDRAGEPDGSYSAVTDAHALEVIAGNYGACRFDQDRLTELQKLLVSWGMALPDPG